MGVGDRRCEAERLIRHGPVDHVNTFQQHRRGCDGSGRNGIGRNGVPAATGIEITEASRPVAAGMPLLPGIETTTRILAMTAANLGVFLTVPSVWWHRRPCLWSESPTTPQAGTPVPPS